MAAQGRLEEALSCYAESLEIHRSIRLRRGEVTSLHHLGATYFRKGEYVRARRLLQESNDIAIQLEWEAGRRRSEAYLGYLEAIDDAPERGRERLERTMSQSQEAGDREGLAQAALLLGKLFERDGEELRAEELLDQARGLRGTLVSVELSTDYTSRL